MKLIRSFSLVLLLLSVSATLVSANAAPALWRVDDDSGRGSAYLFGSVHFGKEVMYPFTDKVIKAFAGSDLLAVELDPAVIDGTDIAAIVMKYGHYSQGQKLSGRLSEEEWTRLVMVSESLGLTQPQLDNLKPWLVAVQLTSDQIREQGFSEKLGVDHYFLTLAKASEYDKPIVQLETLEQQLAVIDALPEEQQVDFLLQTLERSERGSPLLSEIVTAWCSGDQKQLEVLMLDTLKKVGGNLQQRLFIQRNKLMMEKIVKNLRAQQQLFVVVGAGHIIGEYGLEKMLSDQGFRVTRVQ